MSNKRNSSRELQIGLGSHTKLNSFMVKCEEKWTERREGKHIERKDISNLNNFREHSLRAYVRINSLFSEKLADQ